MSAVSECIFCRIVAGEIPAEVVAKGDGYLAFLDVQPLADGHVLVVSTAHVATIEELDAADADRLFRAVRTLAGPTRQAVGAAGSIVGINNGEATGQTIPHVHVHIVPRWAGDNNFMPVIADTKVMPQSIEQSYAALKGAF